MIMIRKSKIGLLRQLLVITFLYLMSSCKVYNSTNERSFSKLITHAIEKNYVYKNAFYYQIDFKRNIFLLWYYDKSIVYWFRYKNRKILDKGTFKSNNDSDNLNVFQTNVQLKKDLDIFEKGIGCKSVLDGEAFGYVLDSGNQEFVGLNFISSSECVEKNNSSFIGDDFKKIRDLNYKFGL